MYIATYVYLCVMFDFPGLRDRIVSHINSLSPFDPLWQDDMHSYYQSFVDQSPTIEEVTEKVEMYFAVEKDIANIPEQSIIGCIQLTICLLYTSDAADE